MFDRSRRLREVTLFVGCQNRCPYVLAMLAFVEEKWAFASHPKPILRTREPHGIGFRSTHFRLERGGGARANPYPMFPEILLSALANRGREPSREQRGNWGTRGIAGRAHLSILVNRPTTHFSPTGDTIIP